MDVHLPLQMVSSASVFQLLKVQQMLFRLQPLHPIGVFVGVCGVLFVVWQGMVCLEEDKQKILSKQLK